jgi:polyisoprenoid-binding protein YceI
MRRATGTLQIFTFKEGLLSAVAHDLRLGLAAFPIELDGETVRARIPLGSLRVDGVVRDGVVQPGALDGRQRADIERAALKDVLRADRYPAAEFDGTAILRGTAFDVRGALALAGRSAPVTFTMEGDGRSYRGHFAFRPSAWGIQPYRALLGAIRLQDHVRIELAATEVPSP